MRAIAILELLGLIVLYIYHRSKVKKLTLEKKMLTKKLGNSNMLTRIAMRDKD